MKYKKVTQKPYCCTAACLEMILNRNNIPNNGQEDIAYDLGLIVPEDYSDKFKKVRTGPKPIAGYGTQIQEEKYSINHFFKMHNISLIEEYHYIDDEKEAVEFLKESEENDVIICANCSKLYDSLNEDYGHMVLFDHIEEDNIVVQDPEVMRNLEKIKISKVMEAIKYHGEENAAGFWLIKRLTK